MNKIKTSCYETGLLIKKGDLLIANISEFNLTEGRVYVAVSNQSEGTFGDCVFVVNDQGKREDYSSEYFCPYEGEIVSQC